MMRTVFGRRWLAVVAAVVLSASGATGLAAQDPDAVDAVDAVDEFDEAAEAETPTEGDDIESIEEILEGEAEMMAGGGYGYDPGTRRDPFKSLLRARDEVVDRGPRPEGIPGLLIEEIDLTGIFITREGPVAQVQSADQDQSYLLRVGDQLYDGDVIAISDSEITFKQMVDDPAEPKPFRELVKKLNP